MPEAGLQDDIIGACAPGHGRVRLEVKMEGAAVRAGKLNVRAGRSDGDGQAVIVAAQRLGAVGIEISCAAR